MLRVYPRRQGLGFLLPELRSLKTEFGRTTSSYDASLEMACIQPYRRLAPAPRDPSQVLDEMLCFEQEMGEMQAYRSTYNRQIGIAINELEANEASPDFQADGGAACDATSHGCLDNTDSDDLGACPSFAGFCSSPRVALRCPSVSDRVVQVDTLSGKPSCHGRPCMSIGDKNSTNCRWATNIRVRRLAQVSLQGVVLPSDEGRQRLAPGWAVARTHLG